MDFAILDSLAGQYMLINEKTFYVPESTNQVALDSFIWMDKFLYIFQFTIAEKHKINDGLFRYLDRYPELPPIKASGVLYSSSHSITSWYAHIRSSSRMKA